jgi:hypothetical protein
MGSSLRAGRSEARGARVAPGAAGRWLALAGALVGGLVLAIVLLPQFAPWTAHAVFPQHRNSG